MLLAISVDLAEPFENSLIELDRLTEPAEILLTESYAFVACLIDHQLHIAENIAGIVIQCNVITFLPELPWILSDCLDKTELLHVSRRQRAVKIIDKRDDWMFSLCYNTVF